MRRPEIAIAGVGFILSGAQLLLLRRALALSGGDEVVFALTLGLWLFFVSLGSALGSRLIRRVQNPLPLLGGGILILGLGAFASLVSISLVASRVGWVSGTISGSGGLIIPLIVALLLLGVLGGVLFPLSCRLLDKYQRPIPTAYALEALGCCLSGLLLSLLFAPHMGILALGSFFAWVGILLGLTLLLPRTPLWMLIPLTITGMLLGRPGAEALDRRLVLLLRPGQDLIQSLETPYGLVEVTRRQGQITVYENNLPITISDNPALGEEQADLFLAFHPHPQRVLWIGGLLGPSLPEALKDRSIQRLDVVEINPVLHQLSAQFDALEAIDTTRLARHLDDGRRFLQRANPQTYDLIALHLPGPRTARLAKFYTVEGFRAMHQALRPGGVLVFAIESSEDFIGSDLALLLTSLRVTLQEVFPQVHVFPGENALFAAGDTLADIPEDHREIVRRWAERNLHPTYWDSYRLQDRFSPERLRTLQQSLATVKHPVLNRDAAPISFYFQQVLWSRQVRGGWASLLKALRSSIFPLGVGLIGFSLLVGVMVRLGFRGKRLKIGLPWAVVIVGGSGIALEILALTSYQIQFGSGYREVGLLIGSYMAGLAAGAFSLKFLKSDYSNVIIRLQAAWVLAPLGLMALLGLSSTPIPGHEFLYRIIFFAYLLLLGLLGGLHFTVIMEGFYANSPSSAGRLYALDLMGACCGALLIGLLLLPLAGMATIALGLILLNLAPLILLWGRSPISP